jgi:hypothetical protein
MLLFLIFIIPSMKAPGKRLQPEHFNYVLHSNNINSTLRMPQIQLEINSRVYSTWTRQDSEGLGVRRKNRL